MTEQDSCSGILYVCNAFSANMLFANYHVAVVRFEMLPEEEAKKMLESIAFESAIGHESTAKVLSERLGQEIRVDRTPVSLQVGDQVLICQIAGGRLPEGKILSEEEVRRLPITYILARLSVTETRW
jgi:DNA-directed RNA polymerase subunit H (RpoH/RPB5)